ncbi:unnamed protein product, partial [Rotaria sp. Silwood2]
MDLCSPFPKPQQDNQYVLWSHQVFYRIRNWHTIA